MNNSGGFFSKNKQKKEVKQGNKGFFSNLQIGIINKIQKHEEKQKNKYEQKIPILFESEILNADYQRKLIDFIGFEDNDQLTFLAQTNDDDFDGKKFKKFNKQQGETVTVAISREQNCVYGAYAYIDDKKGDRESYFFSLANDGYFDKYNYKVVKEDSHKIHPALLLLGRESLELVSDAKPKLNDVQFESQMQTKDTVGTDLAPSPRLQQRTTKQVECLYSQLTGTNDFKIDHLEIWLVKPDGKPVEAVCSEIESQKNHEVVKDNDSQNSGEGFRNDEIPQGSIISQNKQDEQEEEDQEQESDQDGRSESEADIRQSMGTVRQEVRKEVKRTFESLDSKQIVEMPPPTEELQQDDDPMRALMEKEKNSYNFMMNVQRNNTQHLKEEKAETKTTAQVDPKQQFVNQVKQKMEEKQVIQKAELEQTNEKAEQFEEEQLEEKEKQDEEKQNEEQSEEEEEEEEEEESEEEPPKTQDKPIEVEQQEQHIKKAKTVAQPKEEPVQLEEAEQARNSDPMRKLMEQERNQYNFMVNIQKQNTAYSKKDSKKATLAKKQDQAVDSDEDMVEDQDMTPTGDLTKHASDVQKYSLQFSELKDLNYLWMKSKKMEARTSYDDLACMCLEWNYWQYLQGGSNQDKHRFVQFMPNLVVDVECLCEMDINFDETGYNCERCGDVDVDEDDDSQSQRPPVRERPFSLYRAIRPAYKTIKRKKGKQFNPMNYKDKNVTWFGNEWFQMNGGRYPSRDWLLKGLINQDEKELRRLFPSCSELLMETVLEQRAITWQLLCKVSEFSDGNMSEPIKEEELNDAENPLVKTILYISQMECSIRYALQDATSLKEKEYLKDLGPFAFVLGKILEGFSKKREQTANDKFTVLQCGLQMADAQMKELMELVGCTINLHGFLSSGNSKREAQKTALDSTEKGKSAVLLHIYLKQYESYVKLNDADFTPYHRTEQHTIFQDGSKLILDSVQKEKLKEKVKGKCQTLVTLKLRSPGQ